MAERGREALVTDDDAVLTTALTYTREAAAWHDGTPKDRTAAWRESYERLQKLVAPGGVVLDLGCGGGEDALATLHREPRAVRREHRLADAPLVVVEHDRGHSERDERDPGARAEVLGVHRVSDDLVHRRA